MKNLVEDLKAVVEKMQDHVKADVSKNGIIVIAMADGEMTAAVEGSPAELARMVSRSMNADDNVAKIFSKGVEYAPMLGLRDLLAELSKDDDGTPCDCELCTARRERAKSNTNVN